MTSGLPDDNASLFRHLIVRAVEVALADASHATWWPHPTVRPQVLFALNNGLRWPGAWPQALNLLTAIASRMEQAGERSEWLAYLDLGLQCCAQCGDRGTAARLLLERGILLERLGRLIDATDALKAASVEFLACGDRRSAAQAHNRLAYVLCTQQQHEAAIDLVTKAMALLDESDTEVLYSEMVLGLCALNEQVWDKASQHLYACVVGWHKTSETRWYAVALSNLGMVFVATGGYGMAARCFEEARERLGELGDVGFQAMVALNLGAVHLFLKQPEAAAQRFNEAERIYRALHNELRLAVTYSNLGLAYTELERWSEAQACFDAAIRRFAGLESHAYWVDTLVDVGYLHLKCGERDAAVEVALEARQMLGRIGPLAAREHQERQISALLGAADHES